MKYRTANGRLELGAVAGATVQSVLTDDEGWYISRKLRMNAALKASVYEPRFNLQFDLQAARYLYGDYGVRATAPAISENIPSACMECIPMGK